jgi:biotin synthase
VTLWDPSSQLRFRKKSSVPPRPDGAPNRGLPSAA